MRRLSWNLGASISWTRKAWQDWSWDCFIFTFITKTYIFRQYGMRSALYTEHNRPKYHSLEQSSYGEAKNFSIL